LKEDELWWGDLHPSLNSFLLFLCLSSAALLLSLYADHVVGIQWQQLAKVRKKAISLLDLWLV
jgi:hypothetical protein